MSITITADLGAALAEDGTAAHREELEALADAVRELAPGAAAALVDWTGTEISRLRAWAVARSALVAHVTAARDAASAYAAGHAAAQSRDAFRLVA